MGDTAKRREKNVVHADPDGRLNEDISVKYENDKKVNRNIM